MKKILLSCFVLWSSMTFAQAVDLQEVINQLDDNLSSLSQKNGGQTGKMGYFIKTTDNKFIRFHSILPSGRGMEINPEISQQLLSQGSYEGKDIVNKELGLQCKFIKYMYDKQKNLGVIYGEGCEKMN